MSDSAGEGSGLGPAALDPVPHRRSRGAHGILGPILSNVITIEVIYITSTMENMNQVDHRAKAMVVSGLPQQFGNQPDCGEDQGELLEGVTLVLPLRGVLPLSRGFLAGDVITSPRN